MKGALRQELTRFERETIPFCDVVTERQLELWLARFEKDRSVAVTMAEPEFPSHSGRKRLLDYQQETLEGALSLVKMAGARALISLPTGGGKTFTALRLIYVLLGRGYRKILWLAPQRLLVEQAQSELRASWFSISQQVSLRLYGAAGFSASNSNTAVIRFETIQKMLREPAPDSPRSDGADLVVVDEAHHLQSNEFGALISRYGDSGATIIGLTATPGRASGSEFDALRDVFGNNLVYPQSLGDDPIAALRYKGVYADINYRKLKPTRESSEERVIRRNHGSRQKSFAFMPGRLEAIVKEIQAIDKGSRSLVFGATIAHCLVICAALSVNGVSTQVVGSEFGAVHNQRAVNAFREGSIHCMVNVKFAAVGADFPFADHAILSVPLGSAVMFEQIVGRIARGPAVGGTTIAELCDFDGHFSKFGGVQGYSRFKSEWG